MKTKLHKNIIRLTALILILSIMPSGLGLAISARPEAAVPFEDELIPGVEVSLTLSFDQAMALTSTDVFQYGADRLAALQNNDGGWDWPLDDGNPANVSPKNTVGPIAQGLAESYMYTADADHLAALQDAGALLLAKTNNFSPSDGYLAVTLDAILGGTAYTDHVVASFYAPLAAGVYNRNGAGTLYNTAGYVNLIRTTRANQGIANLGAWDVGIGLVGAAAAGADTAAWIDGTKGEINELDGDQYYDVIGLAGALYGLAYVDEPFDPTAGEHASASSLADLGLILAGYRLGSGGFTWSSNAMGAGDESIQETAYAILALNALDRAAFLGDIQAAADYVESVQLATGGWESYMGSGENNEITGEALWGIFAAYPYNQAPVAEANGPYIVAVGQSILLDHTGSTAPDGDPLSYSWAVTGEQLGSVSMETFTAGSVAGITEVTLTVDYGWGETATDTAMLVVYDPSGGFVTGGGWIDSPAGAMAPLENTVFFNGFESDINGWSTPTRVTSGTDGIPSASGSYHAEMTDDFTRWGGYNAVFPVGGYITSIDVYLDMDAGYTNDTRFDWTSAIGTPANGHRRDFIFNGGFYNDATGPGAGQNRFVFSASNNAPGWPKNPGRDPFALTTSGWYTLQHRFYDSGAGILAVDLSILDSAGDVLHAWTLSDPTDVIGTTVGGNQYGWFASNGFPFLAVDNSLRQEFSFASGKASFGFVSKYRRGATVPDGNTEFMFKAGNLNFHSTAYDWLVVNQAGTNAQFKGTGTINGQGNYKFQLWAGDGTPDTFRIRIWYEQGGSEVVVYDNGMNQPIGGGSIVVQKR